MQFFLMSRSYYFSRNHHQIVKEILMFHCYQISVSNRTVVIEVGIFIFFQLLLSSVQILRNGAIGANRNRRTSLSFR